MGWFAPFTTTEVSAPAGQTGGSGPPAPPHRDRLDLLCRMDLAGWLPDNLLERGDRMSMAASLEVRPPFLDHRLVEPACGSLRREGPGRADQKWVVKEVADRYLPTVDHPASQGRLQGAAGPWFRTGMPRDLSRDLLLSQNAFVADLLDQDVIRQLLESHASGRRQEQIRIWTLLSLEQWARVCI